jgi:hypothetical protein
MIFMFERKEEIGLLCFAQTDKIHLFQAHMAY